MSRACDLLMWPWRRHARPPAPPRHGAVRPGMTLVETLVGLVLLGLVAALGFAALGLVGRAGAAVAVEPAALLAVQDLLRLRLLAALPVPGEAADGRPTLLFEGEAARLRFVAELPPRFGTPGPALLELYQEGDALLLRWRPLRGAAAGEGATGRVLLEGISVLRLRYFGAQQPREAAAWRETWPAAPALPMAVELSLAFPEGDARAWPPLVVAPRLAGPAAGSAAP